MNQQEAESELIEDVDVVASMAGVVSDEIEAQSQKAIVVSRYAFEDHSTGYTKIMNFDPDSDGLIFDLDQAKKLHRNMNLLEFIRKRILSNKAKFFDQNIKTLTAYLAKESICRNTSDTTKDVVVKDSGADSLMSVVEPTPLNSDEMAPLKSTSPTTALDSTNWETKRHDKALLKAFSDHGYNDYVNAFNSSHTGGDG